MEKEFNPQYPHKRKLLAQQLASQAGVIIVTAQYLQQYMGLVDDLIEENHSLNARLDEMNLMINKTKLEGLR
jgi:hypothetical protein